VPIIAVGGIMTPSDALEKLDAGAALVQVYSGLVFYGPSLVHDINQAIVARLQ
jgi:dihydroorotate dehydrogenase